jgi:hypothetical protein
MRNVNFAALLLVLALAPAPAGAQPAPKGGPPQAAPQQAKGQKPYKPVAVKLPPILNDPSFDAFRKEVTAVAQRKDRAALARMVVAKGFFWEREDGKGADDAKSGLDNLAVALNLDADDGMGWNALAKAVSDGHAAADAQRKGVVCAPAPPGVDDKDFDALAQATGTEPIDWGFPNTPGVEVRAAPRPDAPVIEKLGLFLIRAAEETPASALEGTSPDWVHIVTPGGKVGYVPSTAMSPLAADQICYLKDASGWKLSGIVGGGGDQQ